MKLFGLNLFAQPQIDVQGALLLDVRTPAEFAQGSVPGAVNIPLQQLQGRMRELPKNKKIVTFCRSGGRSGSAAAFLRSAGYQVENGGTVSSVRAALG